MAAPATLPVSTGPDCSARPLPQQLRAYRLSVPSFDQTLVLVVDGEGDPVGWTIQADPLDSARGFANLYRKLSRLTHGSVAVNDIECLTINTSGTKPPTPGVLKEGRSIRVLEGGRR